MLRIEKTLQDIRELQKELADIGVHIELEDDTANSTSKDVVALVTMREPLKRNEIQRSRLILMRIHTDQCLENAFPECRLRLIERLVRYYEDETKTITDKCKELCGGEEAPLPDSLQARRKSLADTADKLHGLIKDEPPALNRNDYRLLEGIARDPQAHVTLDDEDYRRLKSMGLVVRGYRFPDTVRCDGLTELGEKAMERYEGRSGIEGEPPMLDAGDYRILRKIKDRPQGSVTLRDADYERLSGMGLIERRHWYPDPASCDDILTELGLKAVERYEREDRR